MPGSTRGGWGDVSETCCRKLCRKTSTLQLRRGRKRSQSCSRDPPMERERLEAFEFLWETIHSKSRRFAKTTRPRMADTRKRLYSAHVSEMHCAAISP